MLKKSIAYIGSLFVLLACSPLTALAAEGSAEVKAAVPLWLCIPFAGLLFCVSQCCR